MPPWRADEFKRANTCAAEARLQGTNRRVFTSAADAESWVTRQLERAQAV